MKYALLAYFLDGNSIFRKRTKVGEITSKFISYLFKTIYLFPLQITKFAIILAVSMVDNDQLKSIIVKNADFFGDQKKFRKFADDMDRDQIIQKITDVDLECLGYGHFKPDQVMKRFQTYLMDVIDRCKGIKVLKIQFNGFDIGQNKILARLFSKITNSKIELKTLWIHTTHLTNCRLAEFTDILYLTHLLGDINFDEISLQFSHWKFEAGPPTLAEVESSFQKLLAKNNNSEGMTSLKNRKFRLEMSGWYSEFFEAKWFLGFALTNKEIEVNKMQNSYGEGYQLNDQHHNDATERFHKKIQYLMQGLLDSMPNLQEFQIDFRNWNQFLKMQLLKKQLDNLKKENTFQKSLVSKKQQIVEDDDTRELRMSFMM